MASEPNNVWETFLRRKLFSSAHTALASYLASLSITSIRPSVNQVSPEAFDRSFVAVFLLQSTYQHLPTVVVLPSRREGKICKTIYYIMLH